MRTLLIAFLIFITSSSGALALTPPDNEQNGLGGSVDEQGRKQGRWVILGKHKPNKGYPEEGKIEEGDYKDDRKEGLWIRYYKSGNIKARQTFANGRPKGEFELLNDETQNVIKKGAFEKGKGYQGQLETNYADGTPKSRVNFNESGLEDGEVKYYYPNGQIQMEYTAVSGKKTGTMTTYYPNGNVKRKVTYGPDGKATSTEDFERVDEEVTLEDPNKDNKEAVGPPTGAEPANGKFKPNDYNKLLKNGEVWQDGMFKNGKLWDGKIYIYDADGLIQKVEIYKNGRYHSDGQLN